MAIFPVTGDERLICNTPEGTLLAREVAALAVIAPTITYTGTLITSLPIVVTAPIAAFYNGEYIAAAPGFSYVEGWVGNEETSLTSVNFGNLAGCGWDGLGFNDITGLTSFSAPNLVVANGGISVHNCTSLTTLNLPALKVCGLSSGQTGLIMDGCTILTSLSLPVIEYVASLAATGNTALTTVSIGSTLKGVSANINFAGCALTQASVDLILARLVALNGSNGTILYSPWGNALTVDLSGGTNAVPSAAGAANVAILRARGIAVNVNAALSGVVATSAVGTVSF